MAHLHPNRTSIPLGISFYGTLADPAVLGRLLGNLEDKAVSLYRPAWPESGGSLVTWGGKYDTIVDATLGSPPVKGPAFSGRDFGATSQGRARIITWRALRTLMVSGRGDATRIPQNRCLEILSKGYLSKIPMLYLGRCHADYVTYQAECRWLGKFSKYCPRYLFLIFLRDLRGEVTA